MTTLIGLEACRSLSLSTVLGPRRRRSTQFRVQPLRLPASCQRCCIQPNSRSTILAASRPQVFPGWMTLKLFDIWSFGWCLRFGAFCQLYKSCGPRLASFGTQLRWHGLIDRNRTFSVLDDSCAALRNSSSLSICTCHYQCKLIRYPCYPLPPNAIYFFRISHAATSTESHKLILFNLVIHATAE